MKILLATPIYPPEIGGPAIYTKELCERIHQNHEIKVIAYTDSKEEFPGTKLIAVSKQRPLVERLFKYFLAISREAKWADVLYVQNAVASGLPVALVAAIYRKPFIIKFVGDEAWERATQMRITEKRLEDFLENPQANLKIKVIMAIQKFVLRRAKIVTTPSKYLGEVIQKSYGLKPERVKTNYNAIEEPMTLPFEEKRNPHQIMTTARLVSWKGVDGIIQATALLKKEVSDIKLMVAGEGPELQNLKDLANKLKVSENVQFLGRISRAETWALRNKSKIYVLNSLYEGLPHTVLTSFAAKIPVVATAIPGTDEAVYDNKTGLLVPPKNPVELAKAIKKLFDDNNLSQRLTEGAHKLLGEKFSWESHIKTLNGFLETVFSNPIN